jgi:hypothetical protein
MKRKKRWRIRNAICSDLEAHFKDLKDKRIPPRNYINVGNRTRCSLARKRPVLKLPRGSFCRGALEGTVGLERALLVWSLTSTGRAVSDKERCSGRSEVHQLFINWKGKDHFGNLTISLRLLKRLTALRPRLAPGVPFR